MARSVPQSFYKSKSWTSLRQTYISQHSLCEECMKKGYITPAVIVHHKIFLTEDNYQNPEIALNPDFLESVCRDCHNAIHFAVKPSPRWRYENGQLVIEEENE